MPPRREDPTTVLKDDRIGAARLIPHSEESLAGSCSVKTPSLIYTPAKTDAEGRSHELVPRRLRLRARDSASGRGWKRRKRVEGSATRSEKGLTEAQRIVHVGGCKYTRQRPLVNPDIRGVGDGIQDLALGAKPEAFDNALERGWDSRRAHFVSRLLK
jgi:hypothetical protein